MNDAELSITPDSRYCLQLTVAGNRLPTGETLKDFPLLVVLRKQVLRSRDFHGHVACRDGGDICFAADEQGSSLDFELESYDPAQGALTAWVRIPIITGGSDCLFYLLYGQPRPTVSRRAYRVWDRHFAAVLHFACGTMKLCDSSAFRHDGAMPSPVTTTTGIVNKAVKLESADGIRLHCDKLNFDAGCTVEAWVNPASPAVERVRTVAGCWAMQPESPEFSVFDAAPISDPPTGGYLGAVCDGRYIYFAPQHDRNRRHGRVLRFDTHGKFNQADSWQVYDAGSTDGLDARGYYGAIFDGACVYFIPRNDDAGCHTRVLRYDTRLPFQSSRAWDAYDAGYDFACQGGGFDGRYLYFAPGADNQGGSSGAVLRYDSGAPFKKKSAWGIFDATAAFGAGLRDFTGVVFDGRHMYFIPRRFNVALRYDIAGEFERLESWEIFDAGAFGMRQCVGAVFDGNHVYYIPCDNHVVVRFDVAGRFSDPGSWRGRDVRETGGLTDWGYAGGFFDGRFVYFIPFFGKDRSQRSTFHGRMLRYDTHGEFNDAAAWRVFDSGAIDGCSSIGYNGGAFDGCCFYCAPWHDGRTFMRENRIEGHGLVLRGEIVSPESAFILKCSDYGHNGGLGGSIIGPAFTIKTESGHFTARQSRALAHGWRHLAGVYNGECLRLFVDGKLAAEQPAFGRIKAGNMPLCLGAMADGSAAFQGLLDEVRISTAPRSARWLRLSYENQRAPESFCSVDSERKLSADHPACIGCPQQSGSKDAPAEFNDAISAPQTVQI